MMVTSQVGAFRVVSARASAFLGSQVLAGGQSDSENVPLLSYYQ